MSLVIRIVNRLIKRLGWRIVPLSYFRLISEALFRENKRVSFIQVGANDGVRFDDLFFTVTTNRWKGLVIEPLPHMFERLVSNYQDHKDVTPLNIAIHPSLKSASIFYVGEESLSKYPDWVSGIPSMIKEHLLKHEVLEEDIMVQEVKCKTLSQVMMEHNISNLDVLQIDTEGFDYEVLKTIDFEVVKPRVIKFEWMNLCLDDRDEVLTLLKTQGYTVKIERDGSDCIAWLATTIKL